MPSVIWAAIAALVVFLVANYILATVGVPYAVIIAFLLAIATFFGYGRWRP